MVAIVCHTCVATYTRTRTGYSTIMLAAGFGFESIVKYLVRNGADVHGKWKEGHGTAISSAQTSGSPSSLPPTAPPHTQLASIPLLPLQAISLSQSGWIRKLARTRGHHHHTHTHTTPHHTTTHHTTPHHTTAAPAEAVKNAAGAVALTIARASVNTVRHAPKDGLNHGDTHTHTQITHTQLTGRSTRPSAGSQLPNPNR